MQGIGIEAMTGRHAPRVVVGPYPVKLALRFVREEHRRLPKIQGAMWALAAKIDQRIVGAALVGHPQARLAAEEWTSDEVALEVTRVAVLTGTKGANQVSRNACSALYAAAARAARGMNACDLWTSVHQDESGHSLKAAGWVCVGECGGGQWSRESRPRAAVADDLFKVKWAVPWGRLAKELVEVTP
jgi:hypothetical protein